MRNVSHIYKTPIRALLEHLDAWRAQEGWGRDKLAHEIVASHEAADGPARLKVTFEKNADPFKRAHTCATRIFRWFQDDDKDTNLLSVNFLQSILIAMPRQLCISWLNEFLRPLGLIVQSTEGGDCESLDVQRELVALIKEGSESQQAVASLLSDRSPCALLLAHKELTDCIEASSRARSVIAAAIPSNHTPS